MGRRETERRLYGDSVNMEGQPYWITVERLYLHQNTSMPSSLKQTHRYSACMDTIKSLILSKDLRSLASKYTWVYGTKTQMRTRCIGH